MGLAEEFREDLDRIHRRLGLDQGGYAPVEEAPTEKVERQLGKTAYISLLLSWIERLIAEVDDLRAAAGAGDGSGDRSVGPQDAKHRETS